VARGFLIRELARQRREGTTLPECPIETDIGMRVPDVVWASPEFMAQHRNVKELRVAPDLCIEVLSPTNTRIEMAEKRAAYLAAGACLCERCAESNPKSVLRDAHRGFV
jgi:Uma2 family endonuclease